MCKKRLLISCFVFAAWLSAASAFAEDDCPKDSKQALIQARADLNSGDDARREKGTICLLEAVEMVHAQLDDLIAGKTKFTGPIVAPEFLYAGQQTKERSE